MNQKTKLTNYATQPNFHTLEVPVLLTLLLLFSNSLFGLIEEQNYREECNQSYPEIYEKIKKNLLEISGPFTVVDIGASQGYFSLKIARDFPQAKVYMIEGDDPLRAYALREICEQNLSLKNIVFFNKKLSLETFTFLDKHTHFNVVLGLNEPGLIPHNSWKCIVRLGDLIYLNVPSKLKQMHAFVTQNGGRTLLNCNNQQQVTSVYKISHQRDKVWCIYPSVSNAVRTYLHQVYPKIQNTSYVEIENKRG